MESASRLPKGPWIPAAACVGLIFFSACISFLAAWTKSPAFDEPLHLTGGIASGAMRDFRVNPEDPALLGRIAALPVRASSVPLDVRSDAWEGMLENHNAYQWRFTVKSLFQSPGTNGHYLVQRSRFIFVLIGGLCAAVVAWWGWKLAGPPAAAVAVFLYCLDPNFLAHAPLIKNDVASAFLFVGIAMATWQFGRRGTLLSLLAMLVLCAIAVNIKFSGVLFAAVMVLLLLCRAILPDAWPMFFVPLTQRWQRLLVAPAVAAMIAVTSIFAIWGVYRFRFSPTEDGRLLSTNSVVWNIKASRVMSRLHRNTDVPGSMIDAEPAGVIASIEGVAERSKLLPQAWLYGFLYTYSTTLSRQTFFLGHVDSTGVWQYFPVAFLLKTPTATLLMIALGAAAGSVGLIAKRKAARFAWSPRYDGDRPPGLASVIDWWSVACLGLPPLIYLVSAMTANMNIGLRHILPIYPFLFIALGVFAIAAIERWRVPAKIGVGVLMAALAVESLTSWPNFIPFFNAPARLAGQINLLGDSNLDWGQDLKLLANWQKAHTKKLYLCYFGLPDPAFYDIHATHTPGGWFARTDQHLPSPGESCYLAISATALQGIYHNEENRALYRPLKSAKPVAILGESIYIYELPL